MKNRPDIRQMVGGRLRALRNRNGMTQEQVAERAGVSIGYYSEVERGRRNITLLNLQRILQALEISKEDLLSLFLVEPVSDDEAAILEGVSRLLTRGSKKAKRQVRLILQALLNVS